MSLETIIKNIKGISQMDAYIDFIMGGISCLIVNAETGIIVFSTERAEKLFGYYFKGELEGKSIDILLPSEVRHKHKDHMKKYMENPIPRQMGFREPLFGIMKDGTRIGLEIGLERNAMINGEPMTLVTLIKRREA